MQVAYQTWAAAPATAVQARSSRSVVSRSNRIVQTGICRTLQARHTAFRQIRHLAAAAAGGFDPITASSAQPALQEELRKALDDFIVQNKIVLFMKGTQQFPQCGFSNTCVQIFHALDVPSGQFTCVNILEDEALRSGLKEYSMWPTFPQVYIDGEFFGGCDVMIETYQNGELQETVERVLAS